MAAPGSGGPSLSRTIIEGYGEPDILVNAAAVNRRPPMGQLTEDDWDVTMAANLTAPFLLGQRFGPGMAARGWCRIINVAAQQAIRAYGNTGAYGVSKAGLTALSRSQAEVPADFAGVVVFLASDGAAAVTGQTLFVDGGFSAT